MKPYNFRFIVATWATLLMLLTVSCRDSIFDRSEPCPSQETEEVDEVVDDTFGDGIPLTISYESHSLNMPMLRAARSPIDVNQESELRLNGTRVLVFSSEENYLYDAPVTKIERKPDATNKGSITILAKEGNGVTLVLLSNLTAAEKVKTVIPGTKKEEVLNSFEFNITKDTDFSEVGLPMWGELRQLNISQDQSAKPTIGTIHLLRAVARVDVGLNMTAKGTAGTDADFDENSQDLISTIVDPQSKRETTVQWSLEEVHFFNASENGLVAPTVGNYTIGEGQAKATNVSLPIAPGKQDITYTASNNLLKRVIYVPEADNLEPSASTGTQTLPGNEKEYMQRPYLVVKLGYEEVGGAAAGETYFRIDFLKRDAEEATAQYNYLPLLRNHRYKVDIKNISGLGFANLDDAKKGPSANIMYNVLVWNESEMSNVVYDGQYMLGVKKDDFTFYKAKGGTVSTTVQTSWSDGFEVKGLPEWIKVKSIVPSGDDTSKTGEKIVTFEVTQNTDEARDWLNTEEQEGAYIQAGRMRWNLSFRQVDYLDVSIEIFSDKDCTQPLQFIELDERGEETPDNKYTIGKKTFYVRVSSGAKITSVIDNSGEKFRFSSGGVQEQDLPPLNAREVGAGVYEFEVTADKMDDQNNPFERKQNKYLFTAAQLDQTAEAELTINQIEYSIVFYSDQNLTHRMKDDAGVFFMDGKDNSFYVKSNIPYTIWLDNQIIDESVRNNENSDQLGNALRPMVVGYYDQDGAHDLDYQVGKWIKVKEQREATWSGSEMKFKVANDMSDPKIIYGHVKWVAGTPLKSVAWKFPMFTGDNHDAVTMATTNFISAYTLPEANSYPITLGTGGVLIPLSRINHAAQFYDAMFDSPYRFTESDYSNSKDETAKTDPTENWTQYKSRNKLNTLDKDDNVSLEVLWTDVPSVTDAATNEERNPIQVDGTAPLKLLTTIVRYGERYVYLLPGNDAENNYGNLVFGVRSSIKERVDNGRGVEFNPAEEGKKALLWSFHIMLYRKGAIPVNINNINQPISEKQLTYYDRSDMPEYMADWGADIVSWPYDLGAFFFPENTHVGDNGIRYRDKRYRRIGLCYQFGRKDPFPRWKNTEDAPSRLVGHKGKKVTFIFHKGKTISMRESIENPMVMVGNANGHEWLTEGCRTTSKSIQRGACSTFGYYGLWGGAPAVGGATTAGQRKEIARNTTKTVFDPCPYGFSIPTPGYASTLVFDARGDVNQKRFRPNFALSAMGTQMEYYNTYSGNDNTLFSIYDGILPPGEGVWAVSTTYLKQTHYPVILMGFDSGTMNERYQNDILRSSPVLVRPFLNPAESDWEAYIRR